jgi:antitoxin ParD1/3/4
MGKRKATRYPSVTIGRAHAPFISELIASGRYVTASEVVRAGLRMLQDAERSRIKPFTATESRQAFRSDNKEFDALEAHAAKHSRPRRPDKD